MVLCLSKLHSWSAHYGKPSQSARGAYAPKRNPPVMENVVNGPDGVPFEKMIGKPNQDTLITALQNLYNKHMSLVIDAKFRQHSAKASSMAAGELKALRSRLVVSFGSTMALHVLFAVMTVAGGLAYLLACRSARDSAAKA